MRFAIQVVKPERGNRSIAHDVEGSTFVKDFGAIRRDQRVGYKLQLKHVLRLKAGTCSRQNHPHDERHDRDTLLKFH